MEIMTDVTSSSREISAHVGDGLVVPRQLSARASCCGDLKATTPACCGGATTGTDAAGWRRLDLLLWGSGLIIAVAYAASFILSHDAPFGLGTFTHSIHETMNVMWWAS